MAADCYTYHVTAPNNIAQLKLHTHSGTNTWIDNRQWTMYLSSEENIT